MCVHHQSFAINDLESCFPGSVPPKSWGTIGAPQFGALTKIAPRWPTLTRRRDPRRRSRDLADPLRRHLCRQHRRAIRIHGAGEFASFRHRIAGCLHRRRALRTMMRSAVALLTHRVPPSGSGVEAVTRQRVYRSKGSAAQRHRFDRFKSGTRNHRYRHSLQVAI